ncbi:molybdopterin-dependent oxidoreductase [Massilia niastensis]|uniref:molybdopterin-dependent oxidoreductase n=1 Tax=Massilia niastensis TaxID=544911 RepID=UPI000365554B|nr:molybdopterin-dependent oxidoreductase [Massilia niastensis]
MPAPTTGSWRVRRIWRHPAWLPLPLAAGVAAQETATLDVKLGAAAAKRFGAAELAALPQTEIVEARTVGAAGAAETAEVRWRGVLLRDILGAAGMQELDRRALRRSAVVARAKDGYMVLFSWGELFNARLGENVLVVTSVNGKLLPASEGPYALRSLSDTKSGPRHVKWLQHLEVLTIPQ